MSLEQEFSAKEEVWERRSHLTTPHNLGQSRPLTLNIAQMSSHAKSSFNSRNPFREVVTYSATA